MYRYVMILGSMFYAQSSNASQAAARTTDTKTAESAAVTAASLSTFSTSSVSSVSSGLVVNNRRERAENDLLNDFVQEQTEIGYQDTKRWDEAERALQAEEEELTASVDRIQQQICARTKRSCLCHAFFLLVWYKIYAWSLKSFWEKLKTNWS